EPLTDDEVARVVGAVKGLAPEAVAIALLFAFRHPQHEQRLAGALRGALPDLPIATSHEVLPVFREFERASTTTVEAYLRPKVSAYLGRLERDVRARGVGTLRVMTSSGGTLPPGAAATRAASLALSGPAGGVVGARLVGGAVGRADLVPLDMGGTRAGARPVGGGAPPAGRGARGGAAWGELSRRGERSNRDRGRHRGGGRSGDGAGAEAGQRRTRAGPPADGIAAVRRRRAAVWVPARGGGGDAHRRDPAPSG